MTYRVIREGIRQRVGEPADNKWSYPKIGDLIDLSDEARAHLLNDPNGAWVEAEEVSAEATRPRAPRKRSTDKGGPE